MKYVKYRASDGSTRLERLDGSQIDEVQINNVTNGRFYQFRGGQWFANPLRAQPSGGKPHTLLDRNTVTPIEVTDPRVEAVTKLGIAASFYEFRGSSGTRVIFCPELNMLEVWTQTTLGVVRQVTSVRLGEPQVEFGPPADALVQERAAVAGAGSAAVGELPSQSRDTRRPQ
jgi:hypothetical protein